MRAPFSPNQRWAAAARRVTATTAFIVAAVCWATAPATAAGRSGVGAAGPDLLSPLTAAACPVPGSRDLRVSVAVYGVGRELGVSGKVMLAGFEAGWVESHLNNLPCGDSDSLGVFQQRPSQGWGTPSQILNPRYAARQFFVRAQAAEKSCGSCTSGQIAQAVQRSAFPSRYDEAATTAQALQSEAQSKYTGRYSIGAICGAGFRYLDARELSGGTVYLLWDGRSNCVTTIKNTLIGTPSNVAAYVNPDGPGYKSDSGSFSYYAGPATLPAPGCIRWGGSVGTSSYDSGLGHCG